MRRAILSIVCLMLSCAIALCAVNKTLMQAQSMYQSAKTVTDYQAALKKFKSATTDPNYEPAEHKAAIDKGVKDCESKINQLSASLSVSPTSISFAPQGGSTTLSVSTNQGTPSVSPDAGWITVDSRSSHAITLSCAPNSSTYSRSATITVSAGGKTVRVTATQEAASFFITGVEFGSTDYDGNLEVAYGSPLSKDKVKYVSPRFSYTSDKEQTKTVYYKWYNKEGSMYRTDSSPEGYSHSQQVTFKQGANKYVATGRGWSDAGNYEPGTYKIEVWIDGKRAYTTSFEIVTPLTITGVEFGAVDYDNNVEVAYGSPLNKEKVKYVSPRISYTSDKEQTKTLYYKWFWPDGKMMRNDNSPEGYTSMQEVTFKQGSNRHVARGRGWSEAGNYDPGTYRYEIWIDGKRVYSTSFEIVSRLSITDIEFGSCDYSNEMEVPFGSRLYDCDVRFLKPRVSYTSDKEQTKTVYCKIIKPNGSLDTDINSPDGYTYSQSITFRQGSNYYLATGWGNSEPGYYTPGTYKYEVWIDGQRAYSRSFVIY